MRAKILQKDSATPKENFLIYLGKVRSLTDPERAQFHSQGFEIIEGALAVAEPFRALALVAQPESLRDVEELKSLQPHFPQAQILILEKSQKPEVLQSLLHSGLSPQFIADCGPNPDFFAKLDLVRNARLTQSRKVDMRKSASQKYKDLTELNANLERMVDENTFHLKQSHNEEKSKLKQERDLVQFILEMQRARELEEAFLQMRRQLKGYKRIFEVLLFQADSLGSRLTQFQQGQTKTEFWSSLIPETGENKWLSSTDQVILARLVSRPTNRVIRVPLTLAPQRTEIWLELVGSDREAEEDLKSAEQIFKVAKMVFERVEHDESVALASQRWLQIFDGLKEPVAIIGDQFELIRSNSKFLKHGELSDALRVLLVVRLLAKAALCCSPGQLGLDPIKFNRLISFLLSIHMPWDRIVMFTTTRM